MAADKLTSLRYHQLGAGIVLSLHLPEAYTNYELHPIDPLSGCDPQQFEHPGTSSRTDMAD